MLTAKQFAAETEISYPIIIRWLKEEKIPGAVLTDFKVWQIPSTQVARFLKPENRPKTGWKKGRPRKETAKKAKQGALFFAGRVTSNEVTDATDDATEKKKSGKKGARAK